MRAIFTAQMQAKFLQHTTCGVRVLSLSFLGRLVFFYIATLPTTVHLDLLKPAERSCVSGSQRSSGQLDNVSGLAWAARLWNHSRFHFRVMGDDYGQYLEVNYHVMVDISGVGFSARCFFRT